MSRRERSGSAVAILSGLLLLFWGCAGPSEPDAQKPHVKVAPVRTGTIEERLELPARLVPPVDRDTILAPQIAGRLRRVPVAAGEPVAAGQLLAEVDAAPFRDALGSAEADTVRARAETVRLQEVARLTESLHERGISSGEELASDRSALAAASATQAESEARLAQVRRQLGWSRLEAPYAGVVIELMRHEGDVVDGTPSTPVLRLAGSDRTEAAARATGSDLARLTLGAPAELRLPGGVKAAARISRIAAAVDPSTGLGEVRVQLDGAAPAPLFTDLRLELIVAAHESALLVPSGAIRRGDEGGDEVVVVQEGVARVRPVTCGLSSRGEVELLSGVKAGELVVAEDALGLADGTAVEVAPAP